MGEYGEAFDEIGLLNCPMVEEYYVDVDSQSGDDNISVDFDTETQKLNITVYDGEGDETLTIVMNGVTFILQLHIKVVDINHSYKILDKGKTFTLKIKNMPDEYAFTSTDSKIASVSGDGTVKGKKIGNAIIYTELDGARVGCLVSVVKKGIAKACKKATYIGKYWKYSQPNRMKKGYYDCSSLVWKSYKASGKYVGGAKSYAPTAADLCKWCNTCKKRKLGKFNYNKVEKLKYLPGDLLFCTGAKNGRYKNVYHVEMITGYQFYGFDGKRPMVALTWGAREAGYGGSSSDYVGRPFN
jgi:hypothetical protein